MHLNECLSRVFSSVGNGSLFRDSIDHQECLSGWLFKSTTNFHGHDLDLPWWFGAACFNFSVGGAAMLLMKPTWVDHASWFRGHKFPYATFALLLIFVQGPLSFWADFIHMANNSMAHALDRMCAVPLMTLEISKACLMFHHARRGTFLACAVNLCFAVFCFLRSQDAQVKLDREGFVIWHTLWHMFPLTQSAIVFYDFCVLREFDAGVVGLREECHEELACQPKLLSTMLMEHMPSPRQRRRR